jgi:hypothetical protein
MTVGRQPMTVLIDPHEELSPVLFRIEDWLRFCAEPETDDEELLVEVGVRAAGGLGIALEEGARRAPGLYGPDGHSELVPLLPLTSDLRAPWPSSAGLLGSPISPTRPLTLSGP